MRLDGGVRVGWGYCLDCEVHISSNKCHVAQMCHMSCDKKGHVSVRWVSIMWWCSVMWMSLDNNVSSEWHMSVTWQQCVQWVTYVCHMTTMCHVSVRWVSCDSNVIQYVSCDNNEFLKSAHTLHTHVVTVQSLVHCHSMPPPPPPHYNQTCNNKDIDKVIRFMLHKACTLIFLPAVSPSLRMHTHQFWPQRTSSSTGAVETVDHRERLVPACRSALNYSVLGPCSAPKTIKCSVCSEQCHQSSQPLHKHLLTLLLFSLPY